MTNSKTDRERQADTTRVPLTGATAKHPLGTGLGAAAGGIAAGAVAGSMAGGLAGKGIAGALDPAAEEGYWREHFSSRPYVAKGSSFDDYGPAYGYGVDSYGRAKGRSFDELEPELKGDWERVKGKSHLSWDKAKDATRDSWQRLSNAIERAVPGDSDRDGM
jgi:hypothetical protein